MTDPGHDNPRTGLRRLASRKVAFGLGGLAFLGAGAVLAVSVADEHGRRGPTSTVGLPGAAVGADLVAVPAAPATTAPVAATGPATEPSLSTSQRVANAKAAKRVPVLRPLPEKVEPVPRSEIHVRQITGQRTGRTLRIVSAKGDMTAQDELAWVDGGHRAGPVTCTQDFRFSGDAPAQFRPTMLVCWRTSATKSVYTVMVDQRGKPSESASVAALSREWRTLH
jgi:hypothetical protein